MWLQIVWFLSRTSSENIVVLDEPDVYMHPEQQRKLVLLLRERFKQTIVSTHSQPIIDSCDDEDMLWLHRNLKVSKHGIGRRNYDSELEEYRVGSVNLAKSKTTSRTNVHELKLELVDSAKVSIWYDSNELFGSFENTEGEFNEKTEIEPGRYRIYITNPENVEIYLDGKSQIPILNRSKWTDFILNVDSDPN
jgi:ABC-type multidrug transport system ATPase subunit